MFCLTTGLVTHLRPIMTGIDRCLSLRRGRGGRRVPGGGWVLSVLAVALVIAGMLSCIFLMLCDAVRTIRLSHSRKLRYVAAWRHFTCGVNDCGGEGACCTTQLRSLVLADLRRRWALPPVQTRRYPLSLLQALMTVAVGYSTVHAPTPRFRAVSPR